MEAKKLHLLLDMDNSQTKTNDVSQQHWKHLLPEGLLSTHSQLMKLKHGLARTHLQFL